MFWRMFRIGLPSGIQSSMYSIANITVQSSVNRLGVASVTAWSVVDKVASLFSDVHRLDRCDGQPPSPGRISVPVRSAVFKRVSSTPSSWI